ncbi:hypothetical protein QJS04_geneDACA024244 [Acorus gramineus]|uniref:Uncharacterized protein n=1 Tax=Acorus gramineus TaxID=55184 RepID=A0AAV9A1X2_ACOGR|nr:hypothetical protein QJS04_geneDACA024244 [Acorus gramineus]
MQAARHHLHSLSEGDPRRARRVHVFGAKPHWMSFSGGREEIVLVVVISDDDDPHFAFADLSDALLPWLESFVP